ncbi:MAG: hypothetical protein ACT6FD_06400 [Methanosarcinaceae archaeon]
MTCTPGNFKEKKEMYYLPVHMTGLQFKKVHCILSVIGDMMGVEEPAIY